MGHSQDTVSRESQDYGIENPALRQAFENLHRKENEGVQAYIARVNDLVNQRRGLGDEMLEALDVGKVFRSDQSTTL